MKPKCEMKALQYIYLQVYIFCGVRHINACSMYCIRIHVFLLLHFSFSPFPYFSLFEKKTNFGICFWSNYFEFKRYDRPRAIVALNCVDLKCKCQATHQNEIYKKKRMKLKLIFKKKDHFI